jgi:hypothetical protein
MMWGPYVMQDTLNIIVESGITVIKSWERILMESKDGLDADIMVDSHMRSFTSCIISKLMFGHDHCRGMNVTARCHTLFKAMGTPTTIGIPFLRQVLSSPRSPCIYIYVNKQWWVVNCTHFFVLESDIFLLKQIEMLGDWQRRSIR